ICTNSDMKKINSIEFSGTYSKTRVAEFQFLHNKGNLREELNRLIWLHQAMGGVHTAVGRDIPQAHIVWTSPRNQDLSNLSDGTAQIYIFSNVKTFCCNSEDVELKQPLQ
uniref:Uncharacterized protein n=1 Tax=Podarcis muralis TaxID=64176 RepID=A0A670IHM8_PODMU